MANDMTKGAEHVLTHGTARTRAMQGDGGKGGGKGPEPAKGGEGKKRIKRMEIEPAHGGGHVVKHIHHSEPSPMVGKPDEDEVYAIPNTAALHDHIEQHLGGGEGEPGGGEEMAEEQAAGGGAGAGAGPAAAAGENGQS